MMSSVNTFTKFVNADYIHDNSFYVGNNEWVSLSDVKKLVDVLNTVD